MNPFEQIALQLLAQAAVTFTAEGIQELMQFITQQIAKSNAALAAKPQ